MHDVPIAPGQSRVSVGGFQLLSSPRDEIGQGRFVLGKSQAMHPGSGCRKHGEGSLGHFEGSVLLSEWGHDMGGAGRSEAVGMESRMRDSGP
jgi:hypothetical protein